MHLISGIRTCESILREREGGEGWGKENRGGSERERGKRRKERSSEEINGEHLGVNSWWCLFCLHCS